MSRRTRWRCGSPLSLPRRELRNRMRAWGIVFEEVERERECVGSGGVGEQPAVRCDELVSERSAYFRGERGVVVGDVGSLEDSRAVADDLRRPREVRGGDERRVGLPRPRLVGRGVGVEPVPELEAASPESFRSGDLRNVVDPRAHAVELAFEHCDVAVALVERPGDDRRGVTPRRGRPDEGQVLGVAGRRWERCRRRSAHARGR